MESVEIKNGVQTHKVGAGVEVSRKEVGKVVPITQHTEGKTDRIQVTAGKEASHDEQRTTIVQAPTRTGHEGALGTIQDQHGRMVGDLSKVDDSCSIEVKDGMRVRIDVGLQTGLLTRDATGAISIVPQEAPTKSTEVPLHKTESLTTPTHQAQLEAINGRCSPEITNAYLSQLSAAIVDGTPADTIMADFAKATGAEVNSLHNWSESYINSLFNNGIDYAVRASKGRLTGADIETHLQKCSKGFQKSLFLSLQMNNLKAAHELVSVCLEGKIV